MKSLVSAVCFGCLFSLIFSPAHADSKKGDVAGFLKDLKSKDAKTRAAAARELGHIGAVNVADGKEAVPVLLEVLKKDRDAGVRQAAATALGRMEPDPEKALSAFTAALKDKNAGVRSAAATALGQMGAEAGEAVPALRDAQKDKDRGVSRAAAMAIRSIQGLKKK